jgi:hypothetical protein
MRKKVFSLMVAGLLTAVSIAPAFAQGGGGGGGGGAGGAGGGAGGVPVLALAAEVLELVEQARAALEAVQQLEQEVEGRAQPELQVRREAQARAPAAGPGMR